MIDDVESLSGEAQDLYRLFNDESQQLDSLALAHALPNMPQESELAQLIERGFGPLSISELIAGKCFLALGITGLSIDTQQIAAHTLGFFAHESIAQHLWCDASLIVIVVVDNVSSPCCCRVVANLTCVCIPPDFSLSMLTHELTHAVLRTGNRFFDEGLALYYEYLFHHTFPGFFSDGFTLEKKFSQNDMHVCLKLKDQYAKAGQYFELADGSVDRVAYQYALGFVAALAEKMALTELSVVLAKAVASNQYQQLLGFSTLRTPSADSDASLRDTGLSQCRSLWLECRRDMKVSSVLDSCIDDLSQRMEEDVASLQELKWLLKLTTQRALVISYLTSDLPLEEHSRYKRVLSLVDRDHSSAPMVAHVQLQYGIACLTAGRSSADINEITIEGLVKEALAVTPLCSSVFIDAAALQYYLDRYDPEAERRVRALLCSAELDSEFRIEVDNYREHMGL